MFNFLSSQPLPFQAKVEACDATKLLHEISGKLLEKEEFTELKKMFAEIAFYHAFTDYLIEKNTTSIDIMKKEIANCIDKDQCNLFMAYVIFNNGDKSEAIRLLMNFQPSAPNVRWALVSMLLLENRQDEGAEWLQRMAEEGQEKMALESLVLILSLCYHDPSRWIPVLEKFHFLDNDGGSSPDLQDLIYHNFLEFFNGNESVADFLIDNENGAHKAFKAFFPLVYKAKGNLEKAIKKAKELVVDTVVDGVGGLYIDLLKEAGRDLEILTQLKKWRKNGAIYPPFLNLELELLIRIHDHKETLEVCQLISNLTEGKSPGMIYNTIRCHHEAGVPLENRDELVEKLSRANLGEEYIMSVFQILVSDSEYGKALEFIYNCIRNSDSQSLRDYFFQIQLNPNFQELIHGEKETAEEGDFIEFLVDGEEQSSLLRRKSVLSDFIGKGKGAKFSSNSGMGEKVYELVAIRSKYAALMTEIYKDLANNMSDSVKCIKIDENDDDPLNPFINFMESTSGMNSQEREESIKDSMRAYRNRELPLFAARGGRELKDLYEVVFGEFELVCLPLEAQLQCTEEEFKKFRKVLGLSSLIMLHALARKLNVNFEERFLLSQRSFDFIKQNYYASLLSVDCFFNEVADHLRHLCKKGDEGVFLHEILADLLQWIAEFCEVVVVEETVVINNDLHPIMEVLYENYLLSARDGNVLVSEDIFMTKFVPAHKRITSEHLLRRWLGNSSNLGNL